LDGKDFEYKKEATDHAKANQLDVEDITVRVEQEPVEYCLSSVKKMIHSIMEAVNTEECRIFLTGKDNFREKVAISAPYKGNRDASHKPTHYQAIHDYLVNVWKAEVVEGIEADDAMGTAQWEDYNSVVEDVFQGLDSDFSTVICTIDKDLNMIPGWHYNWRNDDKYCVTEKQGLNFFYRQLLTGDSVDNILGCGKREEAVYKTGKKAGQKYEKRVGIGPKEAEKLLPVTTSEIDCYNIVRKKYDEVFGEDAERALRENADLLWIRRQEGLSWFPPEVQDV